MSENNSISAKIKKALTLDGWTNVLTSIGIRGKDKRLSAQVGWERRDREWCDNFYAGDDVAANIVDVVPDEAISKGFKLSGIEDQDQHDKILARLNEIKLNEKVIEAAKLARIHGGAGIIKITEDAKLDFPLAIKKKILSLNVVDRWDLVVNQMDIDGDITSTTFREPKTYSLQVSEGSKSNFLTIHGERVVRFDGEYLPRQIKRRNQYWGDSILNKLENPIRNYQISHDAAALTIQDFDIPVLKMKNLAELMTANCDAQVIQRLEMVNLSKSIAKMIVLDADKEDFEHKARNVTGMKDVLDKIESRLVTATKMPRTKLFGESAGGLGSTGESQSSNWYDFIESYQSNYLKPKMLEIIWHVLVSEFGYEYEDAKRIDVEFNPLWQMSEKEEADLRKVVADTDAVYINTGVVDSTEVALSRFGGDKYSKEMIIDKKLREQEPLEEVEPLEPEEEKAPEVPQEKNTQEIEDLKKELQSFKDEMKAREAKQTSEDVEMILKPGHSYESEIEIKDAHGQPLDLENYKFEMQIRTDDQKTLSAYQLNKAHEKGMIRLEFPKDQISQVKNDSEDVLATASVVMIRPNGSQKIIRKYRVKIGG